MTKSPALIGNAPGKQRREADFYPTPYSITEHLLKRVEFPGNVIEPSAGNGAMVEIFKKYWAPHNIEYFDKSIGPYKRDFLTYEIKSDNIITNPPFSLAMEFVLKAKELANNKIAFFLPLTYLHGQDRYKRIYQDNEFPLRHVYIFTRRPHLAGPLREDGKYITGMMDFAWFIWERGYIEGNQPRLHWIDNNADVITASDDPDQTTIDDFLPEDDQRYLI